MKTRTLLLLAGDIYLGRVKKLNPGLNAAFIEIGHEKDAFIHYSDLSPYIRSVRRFSSDAFKGEQSHLLDTFYLEPHIPKDGIRLIFCFQEAQFQHLWN